MLNKLVQTLRGTLSLLWNFHAFSYYFLLSFRFRIFLFNSVIFLEDLLQYSQLPWKIDVLLLFSQDFQAVY